MKKEKNVNETSEFEKLQKKWYKKLKENPVFGKNSEILYPSMAGIEFEDIESLDDVKFNCVAKETFSPDITHVEYNVLCWDLLRSGAITDKTDLFIFEKHCEGLTMREITSVVINTPGVKKIKRTVIQDRILKILRSANITPIAIKN